MGDENTRLQTTTEDMELVDILEANGGVAKISSVGRVARQARRAAREGYVIRPLPRIVMTAMAARHPEAWMRAVRLWRPSAIFTGRAALYLAGMRDLKMTEIDVIVPHSMPRCSRRPWLRFHRAGSEPVVPTRAFGWRCVGTGRPPRNAFGKATWLPKTFAEFALSWQGRPHPALSEECCGSC